MKVSDVICPECNLPLLEGEDFCLECCLIGAAQFPGGYVATAAGPINVLCAQILLGLEQMVENKNDQGN